MAGLLLKMFVIVLFFVLLVVVILRQADRAGQRRSQQHAAAFKRWAAWYEGKPNPTKYNDWTTGGSERYRRDMAAYPPEPKCKSLN